MADGDGDPVFTLPDDVTQQDDDTSSNSFDRRLRREAERIEDEQRDTDRENSSQTVTPTRGSGSGGSGDTSEDSDPGGESGEDTDESPRRTTTTGISQTSRETTSPEPPADSDARRQTTTGIDQSSRETSQPDRPADSEARRQTTTGVDRSSRETRTNTEAALEQEARRIAAENVGVETQRGLEGRAGQSVTVDGQTLDVQDQAQDLEQRAIEQAEWADDESDVAVQVRDGRLVATPSRTAAIDTAASEIENELQEDFNRRRRDSARTETDIKEDFASDIDAVDPDDVVLEQDGDKVRVDVEATASEAAGEADPGLLARGIAFGARQARGTPVGTALPLVAASLRTRSGVDVPVGAGQSVSLPGSSDVDAAVEGLEPADEAFKTAIQHGTRPARFASEQLDEHVDIEPHDVPGAGVASTIATSSTIRRGVIEGVESGAESLSPAAAAQDAARIADLGIRGTDRAARQGSEEEIQGAINFGAAVGREAAERAPDVAVETAAQNPSKVVQVPVAIGTAGLAGAAFGTGVAAAPRAARSGAQAARSTPRRARQFRRGFDDEVASFREDTRGMAGGQRMMTRGATEETVEVDVEATRGEQIARELDAEDFDNPDELAREQAMLVEREKMPPRSAFESEAEFQSTLNQRAARRLGVDEDELVQGRQGTDSAEETVEAVAQKEAEGFGSPATATTVGASAYASREAAAEEEALGMAPAEVESEVSAFGTLDEATVSAEAMMPQEAEATGEKTLETTLETEAVAEDTLTREAELTATTTTRPRGRARRTRRFDLPDLESDVTGGDAAGDGDFAREFEFGVASSEDVLSGESGLLDDS